MVICLCPPSSYCVGVCEGVLHRCGYQIIIVRRLITKGPPVRVPLHRLSREAMEWCEKAIQEDCDRGQLKKGNSPWGSPAFPTQEAPAHKAIKRARRLVVDYRALNRVTVRKVFLIPDSDQIKATVAGNIYISVGDLKGGFNQCDNEEETARKRLSLSPRGLIFLRA